MVSLGLQAGGTMRLLSTWILRSVPFGSERDRNGMLGQERPGPQGWLGGSWDYILLPAFKSPDFAPPGEGHLPGAIDINLDLYSLKARKSFLVCDLTLPCSQYGFFFFFFLSMF